MGTELSGAANSYLKVGDFIRSQRKLARLSLRELAAALNCTGMGARGGIQGVARIEELMAAGARHVRASVAGT